jgi:NAD(P)-dependent dehydrogenase (short-subunit alcohol dehydrogenase family)
MPSRLEGKNCIITGAAGGIGLETSILFVQNGANLLMSDINEDLLKKAFEKVKTFAPDAKVDWFVCSMTAPENRYIFGPISCRPDKQRSLAALGLNK